MLCVRVEPSNRCYIQTEIWFNHTTYFERMCRPVMLLAIRLCAYRAIWRGHGIYFHKKCTISRICSMNESTESVYEAVPVSLGSAATDETHRRQPEMSWLGHYPRNESLQRHDNFLLACRRRAEMKKLETINFTSIDDKFSPRRMDICGGPMQHSQWREAGLLKVTHTFTTSQMLLNIH